MGIYANNNGALLFTYKETGYNNFDHHTYYKNCVLMSDIFVKNSQTNSLVILKPEEHFDYIEFDNTNTWIFERYNESLRYDTENHIIEYILLTRNLITR